MSDCMFCEIEDECGYEYKPCDCVHQRKFKPKPEHLSRIDGDRAMDRAVENVAIIASTNYRGRT